jgi:hypothetical protein
MKGSFNESSQRKDFSNWQKKMLAVPTEEQSKLLHGQKTKAHVPLPNPECPVLAQNNGCENWSVRCSVAVDQKSKEKEKKVQNK